MFAADRRGFGDRHPPTDPGERPILEAPSDGNRFMQPDNRRTLALVAFLLVVLSTGDLVACPMCAESVAGEAVAADGSPQPNLPRAYMWSIFFMLGMPAVVFGVLGGLVVRAIRAADAVHALPESREPRPEVNPLTVIPMFDAVAGETAVGVSPA